MSIATHLGRIATCGQFFVYRLSGWDGSKYREKQPWRNGRPHNPGEPRLFLSYHDALSLALSSPQEPGVEWAVGLWITDNLNLFFLDIDRLSADYTLDSEATELLQRFPGCMTEWSSSRRGLHILGTRTETVDHANRVGRLELYTHERGIVLSAAAAGTIDTDATVAYRALASERFERRGHAPGGGGGPIVILPPGAAPEMSALTLALRQADRVSRAPDGERNSTLNTAAFTLGGLVAAGRITYEDARAALVSAVERVNWWGNKELQLSKIDQGLKSGMGEPLHRAPVEPVVAPAPAGHDWHSLVDSTISRINNTGTYRELSDTVVPEIGQLGIPEMHAERVVQALSKRLELFDAKLPIGKVRELVTPARVITPADSTPPDWFAGICYISRIDKFYDGKTGKEFSAEGFRTEYSRFMPYKQNGDREDPVKWARERWNITTVYETMYRPDCPPIFEHGGTFYANEFIPSSLPAVAPASASATAAIQLFQEHLYLLCNRRDHIYFALLFWLAHNVQKPGRKIRWSPIIKGVQGDGKSIVSDLMRATLGIPNVKMTSISNLSNSGGFTDWATGAAVNFIEEIQLTGKERYKLFNSMKTYIADNYIDINRKGRPSGSTVYNVTNHWANTNYSDALPIDDSDRRWCVVFTPYTSIAEAVSAKGLDGIDSLVAQFKVMGESMRAEPGAWKAWLMGIDTSSFDPDGRAPETGEKITMKLVSQDSMDQQVMDVLEQGGIGITKDCFCSKSVSKMVELHMGERPATRTWNSVLARLGYSQHERTVWWNGSSRRIWVKRAMDAEEIRKILDSSQQNTQIPHK